MLFQLPEFLQSYSLNFVVQVRLLQTLLPVSHSFQQLVRASITWKGLTIPLAHLDLPRDFYFNYRDMLSSCSKAIVTFLQSGNAAQLGCPLWTTWVAGPPWTLHQPRPDLVQGRPRPYLIQGRDPPSLLSIEPVARNVAFAVRWTGDLYHLEVGLTSAITHHELEASKRSLNERWYIRTSCVILSVRRPSSMALQLPGPWFVNNVSTGEGFPVDVSPYIIHSWFMGHDELALSIRWTRSGISVYSGQNRLSFQGFGPAYLRPYLETFMNLYIDLFEGPNLVASIYPRASYLGPGGLRTPNALCFLCRVGHLRHARYKCSFCQGLYCSDHVGILTCARQFTSCGVCIAQHRCL